MQTIIKSKNFQLSEAIGNYIQKKLNSLKKFLASVNQELIKAEVEVERITGHKSGDIFRAEINLSIGGRLFRVESERDDLYSAIDEVRDDLEQEIKKFKTKRETIYLRGARSIKKQFGLSEMVRFRKQK